MYQEQDELGLAQEAAERARAADPTRQEAELLLGSVVRPPPPPRTKWTRRVPHPVLIGHVASLSPY